MSSPTSIASPFGGTDKLTKLAWGTLLVLCGALFLDALDVSMMGVALPSIKSSLGMSTSSLQWVVSAYVLGYGGFLLLGGRAADLLIGAVRFAQVRQQFKFGLVADASVRSFDLDARLIKLHDQTVHRYFQYLGKLRNSYVSHQ